MYLQFGIHIINIMHVDLRVYKELLHVSISTNDYRYTSGVRTTVNSLGIESLEKRMRINRVVMLCKMTHGLIDMNVQSYLNL